MNETKDLLLAGLYQTPHSAGEHALAARYAPILRFDANEPFLPIAAGYTLFTKDGTSPSMRRAVLLRPEGKPPAVSAIEYAIWWDWDIHHLYELEHVWVYISEQGRVVRVEASWHGKYNEMAVHLEGDHAVLLSEPGKHAFADRPEPFLKHAAEARRSRTQFNGAQAHVLINDMFAGQIRSHPFDTTLVRSYLAQKAFNPAWEFSQVFRFQADWLVPWSALCAWIPRRVNAWLDRLKDSLAPEEYRAKRLVSCNGSLPALEAAAQSDADGLVLPVVRGQGGAPAIGDPQSNNPPAALEEVFQFCHGVPFSVLLDLHDESIIGALADFLNEKKVFNMITVTAARPAWLARLKALAPKAVVSLQIQTPTPDPLPLARECKASSLLLRWEHLAGAFERLTPEWVEHIQANGLSLISWPLHRSEDARALERLRVDAVWLVGLLPDA